MDELPKNLLELIDLKSFRERPGMYIGVNDINILEAFVDGYILSEEICDDNKGTARIFWDFRDWLAVKINQPDTTAGWNHMIQELVDNDNIIAIERFFELIDEFRVTAKQP